MRKIRIDKYIEQQEAGLVTPAQAAKLFTGDANQRTTFYASCWRRHLQVVAERRYRRAKR